MRLSGTETLIMILALAAGTQLTRWLPFWLFPENRRPPAVVLYLGRVLPPAVMGLLVVYCLRNIQFAAPPQGAAEMLSVCLLYTSHECAGAGRQHPVCGRHVADHRL